MKDKFLVNFYIFLFVIFLICYYFGEERTRKFENEGFELCKINGIETWVRSCAEPDSWF